ncbi:type II toxin-antitoxin system RelE/ParE family toxin [Paraburkholderia sp. J76]|uniref:type II toxin-antitoxin system RelE/ParE family toxin n=1 Tax=Paraburkholderia sp. J76 TaxID=2805439 RepID=UPI002ABD5A82|nr:type II toxin-antitoxin system RelE/ParE family toxin [Paraburkholderia sp. J76]
MSGRQAAWTIRLTDSAETDFRNIVRWSAGQFGQRQATAYAKTLSHALQELMAGPTVPGTRVRDDILPGLRSLHVARNRRKGRHFVLFRVSATHAQCIDVLRILHDAMDLPRHFWRLLRITARTTPPSPIMSLRHLRESA